jgi:hypothetical protein
MKSASNEITGIHHIAFMKINRHWFAQIFSDLDTCISWQKVGTLRNVKKIIRDQLDPLMIQAIIKK